MATFKQLERDLYAARSRRDFPATCAALRMIYEEARDRIMTAAQKGGGNPYYINWVPFFTPIEYVVFDAIRNYGLPLFPQIPVGNYFIDFADPHRRIGVEVDGSQHVQEKDKKRDTFLHDRGWSIFRIPGRETTGPELQFDHDFNGLDEEQAAVKLEEWALNTSDGAIYAIGNFFYGRPNPITGVGEYECEENLAIDLIERVLDQHTLTGFDRDMMFIHRGPPPGLDG